MIALVFLLLCSVAVDGFGLLGTETRIGGYKDNIDRILEVLETGSDSDKNVVFTRNTTAVRWEIIFEQSILQKKDAALISVLNYPKFIDWSGNDSGSLVSVHDFAVSLQRLMRGAASLVDLTNEGKILATFIMDHEADIVKLNKNTAAFVADFVFYWMVSVKSVDDVQNISNHNGLLNSVSQYNFEYLIRLCIEDDNVDVFKVFMENTHSFERVQKHSKSLWRSVFPKILDYRMNLAQSSNRKPSQLSSYILSSSAIMQTMDSNLVTAIFYASFTNFENLNLISRNEEAMKKLNTAQFTRMLNNYFRNKVVNEAAVILWLNRPELSLFLSPKMLGYIFVDSAKKNWIDVFQRILDTDELLSKIDADLLNKGIMINTDEHLEVVAGRFTRSPLLLSKLTKISVGLLFSRYLAFQYEDVIKAFIEREDLMSLVPPQYLAKGIDGLIVEEAGPDTQRILGLFLVDRYIARLTDQAWETIVRHAVRNNKKGALTLLFQHDSIFRRLSTKFLKAVKTWVNQNEKTAIKRIVDERIPDNIFSGVTNSLNRFSDRRLRPKKVVKSPFFTREDFREQFDEIREMVKEITKDGHALTMADQESITRKLMEHHNPNLRLP